MNKEHHQSYYDIRSMLTFIFVQTRKNGRLVPLSAIEQAMSKHANSVFSWCQWCTAAQVLHGHGDSYYLDSRFNGMTFSEFRDEINKLHI